MANTMITTKLVEADADHLFYCNNCTKQFAFVYTFQPVPGLQEYYNCTTCSSVLPVTDLRKVRKCRLFCCFCRFFYCTCRLTP